MAKRILIAALILLSTLAVLLMYLPVMRPAPQSVPLQTNKVQIGGPFSLVNTRGERVTESILKGHYSLVYFGFTYCPDICPTDVQRMVQGLDQFKQISPELGAQVTPIFISVDPERDTPEVLDQFTNAFSPDLVGLTGSPEQIADAAAKFAVFYAKLDGSSPNNYMMDHARTVVLFGPQGEPLALLPADLGADAVTQELQKWVT